MKAKILFVTDVGDKSLSFHVDFAATYDVTVSDRPEQALDTILSVQPHVLVMAFRESKLSPLTLAQTIRNSQRHPLSHSIGVIYLSPREIPEWFERAVEAGVDICLPAGRTNTQLHAAISSAMRIAETRGELNEANQKLARALDRLKKLSLTDELTGLFNMRFLSRQLRTEFKRAQRYQKHLSLLFVNMDNFTAVNDQCGEQMGSDILTHIGQEIGDSVCFEIDYSARWSADEFALLLPETDLVGAISVAERLRRSIEARNFSNGSTQTQITASVGVAHFNGERGNFNSAEELLQTAQRAVQAAKDHGGNQYWALDECQDGIERSA